MGGTLSVGAAWRLLSLDVEGRVDAPSTSASDVLGAQVRSWLLVGSSFLARPSASPSVVRF